MEILIGCLLFGWLGHVVGEYGGKGNGNMGFLLGALLWPLGVLIVALLPPKNPPEPQESPEAVQARKRMLRMQAELIMLKQDQKTKTPASDSLFRKKPRTGKSEEPPTYKLD